MKLAGCYASTDLSWLRLITESGTQSWRAPDGISDVGEGDPTTARGLRKTADEAARWVAQQPSSRKRLGAVVLDVDESLCVWLKAASSAAPVLTSAMRKRGEDWGDVGAAWTVEPLVAQTPARKRPFKRSKTTGEAAKGSSGVAALNIPDALIRLWLDGLDRSGVRVDAVMTLWHAMAQAEAPAGGQEGARPGMRAIVLVEEERLTWAWADGADLLTGGVVALESAPTPEPSPDSREQPVGESLSPIERASRRLSLDWLSWGSQLGASPSRAVVVGPAPGARQLRSALKLMLPDLEFVEVERADPAAWVISSAMDRRVWLVPSEAQSRTCLTRLTTRPTRAVRARYMWMALALGLLAAAAAGVGWRVNSLAHAWQTEAENRYSQARQAALNRFPALQGTRNIVMALEGEYQKVATQKPFEPPPPPPPIFDEISRVLDLLGSHESVRLQRMDLEQGRGGDLQFTVPDERLGVQLLIELSPEGSPVKWERRANNNLERQLSLVGVWR